MKLYASGWSHCRFDFDDEFPLVSKVRLKKSAVALAGLKVRWHGKYEIDLHFPQTCSGAFQNLIVALHAIPGPITGLSIISQKRVRTGGYVFWVSVGTAVEMKSFLT